VLTFSEPITIQGIPETINACIEASQTAVKCEIAQAIEDCSSFEGLLNSSCINQAVEVADQINLTA